MRLTAAKDFTASPASKAWLEQVEHPIFQEAVKVSLIEYARFVAGTPDGSQRLKGAIEVLDYMMNLTETKPQPTLNLSPGLNAT